MNRSSVQFRPAALFYFQRVTTKKGLAEIPSENLKLTLIKRNFSGDAVDAGDVGEIDALPGLLGSPVVVN